MYWTKSAGDDWASYVSFEWGTTSGGTTGGGGNMPKDRAFKVRYVRNDIKVDAQRLQAMIEEAGIITTLPLVYRKPDGTDEVLPHLDLKRKSQIVGICERIRGEEMCVSLKSGGKRTWNDAMKSAEAKGEGWSLPKCEHGGVGGPELDETVATLKKYGVDADVTSAHFLDVHFWTCEQKNGSEAHILHQRGGCDTAEKNMQFTVRYFRPLKK
jgi:hypothetical protein